MKINNRLQIVMLSTIALGLQTSGRAQGNLVNFNGWTNETMFVPPGTQSEFVQIDSPISATFEGGWTTNASGLYPGIPTDASPILTGSLDTVPGAIYEIAFAMQLGQFEGSAEMWFGDFTTNCDLTAFYNPANQGQPFGPVNMDFTVVATSATTTMSFQSYLDPVGGYASLYDVSVNEVPEISAARLFGFGGGVLLFAHQWLRLLQRKKFH